MTLVLGDLWRLEVEKPGLDRLPEPPEILIDILLAGELLAHRVVVEDLLLAAALARGHHLPDPASGDLLQLTPLRVGRKVEGSLAARLIDRRRSKLVDKVEDVVRRRRDGGDVRRSRRFDQIFFVVDQFHRFVERLDLGRQDGEMLVDAVDVHQRR